MDNLPSASIGLDLMPEVKTEPETEIYDIKTFDHPNSIEYSDVLIPKKLELKKNTFSKEFMVANNEKYILDQSCSRMMIGSTEILPGCSNIFPNHTDSLNNLERSKMVHESEHVCDRNIVGWNIKNAEFDIKEGHLESINTRCNSIYSNSVIKIEKNDVLNPPEKHINVNFEEWKIKNEEHNIKEEYLESSESSSLFSQDEPAKVRTVRKGQEYHYQDGEPQTHMNPEEFTMFKCNQCDYESIYKDDFKSHLRRHDNSKEVNMFKCDQCDYQTIYKFALKNHVLQHKNPNEVNMFVCSQCDYKSMFKNQFKGHLLQHKNREKVNIFKCDECGYQTIYNSALKKHVLRHKNPEEVTMFKCDQCDYKSVYQHNIKRHVFRHKNPKEIKMFKCGQCNYESMYKSHINKHLLRHENPDKVNMFKCNECNYTSIYERYFKSHLLRHKYPQQNDVYECDQCLYASINKRHLNRHLLRHKKGELRGN